MNIIDKIQINGTTYDINGPATAQEYGLIKLGYAQNDKNYPVLLSEGKAYVYVPWVNTTYTLGELMGASAKGSVTQPIYWNGSSFVSTTYSLNADVPNNAVFTDTTYSIANAETAGLIKAIPHANTVSYNNPSTTEGKYYSVEVDSNGKAFVNVPWVASQSENGAITEIQMNGSPVTNTNGVVDLGTVVTEDSIALYEVIRDTQDSTAYKLANNKTFNDIHTDYINGKKQINIKYIYDQSCTRIYTLSYIDGSNALFLSFDSSNPISGLTFYYITLQSSSNGYVSLGDNSVEDGIDGSDGEDGVGIDTISITYAASSDGTTAPSSNWGSTIPTVASGNYLWTKIEISYTDNNRSSTIAYSVARLGGSSSQMAITTDPPVSSNILQAAPNTLYRFTTTVSALTIQLQQPSSSDTAVEYLFRFKTAGSGVNISFTDYQGGTSGILYPFDYVININTEYEISVLYDGSKYLVRNCAYQSNT